MSLQNAKIPAMTATRRPRKFLVVVDKSDEAHVAIRFATRRAQNTGGRVTLLCVSQMPEMQQWRGVEEIMKDEAHAEAENLIHDAAKKVNELSGIVSELVILEGHPADCLLELLKSDRDLSILVLATSTAKEGPGPLVATVGTASHYPIPVTIVPGNLSDTDIDELA